MFTNWVDLEWSSNLLEHNEEQFYIHYDIDYFGSDRFLPLFKLTDSIVFLTFLVLRKHTSKSEATRVERLSADEELWMCK